MKLLDFFRRAPIVERQKQALQPVDSRGDVWTRLYSSFRIQEPFAGAWQRNVGLEPGTALAHHAVWACITLIASDIAKLRPKLVEQDADGIWSEIDSSAFSPVLRKPNDWQNYIQFKEHWLISKLVHGNTYALKQRDGRGVVVKLYLLDPCRVTPFVAEDGAIFYQLKADNLAGVGEQIMVPAREMIHDRFNCIFHPLIGVSPIFAAGAASLIGLNIQDNQSGFFTNGSNPGGVLTAPGAISNETAQRLADHWNTEYTGAGAGRIAVLGDGLKFEPMRMTAVDSQLIEQLKWSAEVVCSCFHVPPFKVHVGPPPPYQNAEIMNQIYYSDCLQVLIESLEVCLDEGLGLTEVVGKTYGVELDVDGLLRMDTATQVSTLAEAIKGSLFTVDEARKKVDLKPLPGGNTVYMQQQMFSLEALSKRDQANPFPTAAAPGAPALPAPTTEEEPPPEDTEETRALRRRIIRSELLRLTHVQPA